MKKFLFAAFIILSSISVHAQTVKVKAGTIIPMRSMVTELARDCEIGKIIKFQVTDDIKSEGKLVIPKETIAIGHVTEARKSTVCGTKGKLNIAIDYLTLENGEKIYLTGNVYISGKNKTPLAIVVGCLTWFGLLIPGTKAVLNEGYETIATITNTVEIKL